MAKNGSFMKKLNKGNFKTLFIRARWIGQYAKHNVWAMVFYTLLGLSGVAMSLIGSYISKNVVDVVTGQSNGALVMSFCIMIGMNIGNSFVSLISGYVSNKISMKVDAEIKADIFEKIMITDWESLSEYHTGDLLTRWSADAGAIATGVLNFIPNFIIYTFRFVAALAIVIYYDASFALIAIIGMPFSYLLSRGLMAKMRKNSESSAVMNARMSGFNQEAFSNIQTIKAFDMIGLYVERLKELQKDYIKMRLSFQRIGIIISILTTLLGMVISYASYGWGIYRVWSGAITYGTMTMFLSLSATLTTTMNSLMSLVPTALSLLYLQVD